MTLSLLVAILVLVGGVLFGRLLHLSEFVSVGLGLVPALLVAFPVVRHWTDRKVTFSRWSIAIGVGLVSTWFIYLLLGMH